jgi:hypothetical protein
MENGRGTVCFTSKGVWEREREKRKFLGSFGESLWREKGEEKSQSSAVQNPVELETSRLLLYKVRFPGSGGKGGKASMSRLRQIRRTLIKLPFFYSLAFRNPP